MSQARYLSLNFEEDPLDSGGRMHPPARQICNVPLVVKLGAPGGQKTPSGVSGRTLPKYFNLPPEEQAPEAEAEAEAEEKESRGEGRPPGEQEGRSRGKQRVGWFSGG